MQRPVFIFSFFDRQKQHFLRNISRCHVTPSHDNGWLRHHIPVVTCPSSSHCFRPYTCPCPGASCKWQGSLEQVMPHLMQSHKSITTLQGETVHLFLCRHCCCCVLRLQAVLASRMMVSSVHTKMCSSLSHDWRTFCLTGYILSLGGFLHFTLIMCVCVCAYICVCVNMTFNLLLL